MNPISYTTNETTRTATVSRYEVAIALAAAQGHSVGALHGHPKVIAAAVAAAPPESFDAEASDEDRASLFAVWDNAIMAADPLESGENLGITVPRLEHRTPRGAVNWDLRGVSPRAWIERSRPGQESQGQPGDEVATWFLDGRIAIAPRAEARHVRALAGLISCADPSASAEARRLAEPMERAEKLSELRRFFIALDPLAAGTSWDEAHAALCAAEAEL
jgi:hypothetical protein